MSSGTESTKGAYGFRLSYQGEDNGDQLDDLLEMDPSVPHVAVSWRHAETTVDVEEVSEDRVVYGSRGATTFQVDRDPASIHFELPLPVVPGALVHPLLTVGISVHARWRGDITLHAGAFETPAGAWAVMGSRQAGKSALLAALAGRGCPVVADDLLTIQDREVWAGPTCVDLRPDAAGRFESVHYLGIVGGRPRFRMSTPPGRPRLPLRGLFVLDWHEMPTIEAAPMDARERLHWVYRQEYISLVGWPEPEKLVPLLGLPAWRLTRPPDWTATQDVIDRVLEITNDV
jgi:hypothetical protein